jgi:hypothetical protein
MSLPATRYCCCQLSMKQGACWQGACVDNGNRGRNMRDSTDTKTRPQRLLTHSQLIPAAHLASGSCAQQSSTSCFNAAGTPGTQGGRSPSCVTLWPTSATGMPAVTQERQHAQQQQQWRCVQCSAVLAESAVAYCVCSSPTGLRLVLGKHPAECCRE